MMMATGLVQVRTPQSPRMVWCSSSSYHDDDYSCCHASAPGYILQIITNKYT